MTYLYIYIKVSVNFSGVVRRKNLLFAELIKIVYNMHKNLQRYSTRKIKWLIFGTSPRGVYKRSASIILS